jgi:hypothetical protein
VFLDIQTEYGVYILLTENVVSMRFSGSSPLMRDHEWQYKVHLSVYAPPPGGESAKHTYQTIYRNFQVEVYGVWKKSFSHNYLY